MEYVISTLTITNILFCLLGVVVGIIFGAIPGLTATMGVALFLPITFGMETATAFSLLLGIYCGGIYGGSITAILIRTPGTPSSAASLLDGHPLSEQGRAMEALSMATVASFIGGIVSCILLIVISPQLAKMALRFGPPEYFAVGVFGLSMVASLSGKNFLKGLVATFLGLFVSTIGIDNISGNIRFAFGSPDMAGGIELISALIGLFAISEVISKLETLYENTGISDIGTIKGKMIGLKDITSNWFNLLRSSIIGTFVGIIPATGSSIGSWLSYNEAKRASKTPELFGKGAIEGVAASEAGNNGVTGGALVPLLTLGVPGDIVTAVMLGALMIQGLTPGPMLFQNHPNIVTSIYVMLIVSNIFILVCGLLGINAFVKILKVPTNILMPIVLVFCLVGSFSINNSIFDVRVALLLGILGYLMNKVNIPTPPMLLGIILGTIIEQNFRRALTISQGDLTTFLKSPISLIFILLAVFSFVWTPLSAYLKTRKARKI